MSGIGNQARQTRCLPWGVHILVGEADARRGHTGKGEMMTTMGDGRDRQIGGAPPLVGRRVPTWCNDQKEASEKSSPGSGCWCSLVTRHLSPEAARLAQHSWMGPSSPPLTRIRSRNIQWLLKTMKESEGDRKCPRILVQLSSRAKPPAAEQEPEEQVGLPGVRGRLCRCGFIHGNTCSRLVGLLTTGEAVPAWGRETVPGRVPLRV